MKKKTTNLAILSVSSFFFHLAHFSCSCDPFWLYPHATPHTIIGLGTPLPSSVFSNFQLSQKELRFKNTKTPNRRAHVLSHPIHKQVSIYQTPTCTAVKNNINATKIRVDVTPYKSSITYHRTGASQVLGSQSPRNAREKFTTGAKSPSVAGDWVVGGRATQKLECLRHHRPDPATADTVAREK